MNKILLVALVAIASSAFTCQPGAGGLTFSELMNTTLNFSFAGVDDDETPSCFEANAKVDLTDVRNFLDQLPAGNKKVKVTKVTMTVVEVGGTNTASQVTGTCELRLGQTANAVDLGTYVFNVQQGLEVSQSFDVERVGAWITEQVLANGEVEFNMNTCMGATENADIKIVVKIETEGSVSAPG